MKRAKGRRWEVCRALTGIPDRGEAREVGWVVFAEEVDHKEYRVRRVLLFNLLSFLVSVGEKGNAPGSDGRKAAEPED